MQTTFTLTAQYIGAVQITRGLDPTDLKSPGLFKACSGRLSDTDNFLEPHMFHSGKFEDADGNALSSNPQEWPGGVAFEVNLGPWRYSADDLREVRDYDDWAQKDLAYVLCDHQLQANGFDELEVIKGDGAGDIFDLTGPNAKLLTLLDRAEWRFDEDWSIVQRLDPPATIPESESTVSAYWKLAEGGDARLVWEPEALINGAYLERRRPGRFGILHHFDSIPEALTDLTLRSNGPVDPIRSALSQEWIPSYELTQELKRAVHATRIGGR